MRPVESIVARFVLLLILCGFDFGLLLTGYGVLRVLRISVNWTTWIVGGGIIAASAVACVSIAFPTLLPAPSRGGNNFLGVIALFVAVYAASQWTTRQWYLRVKKHASHWLKQSSRQVLMFLREHHSFFGWVVGAGSVAHMLFFFPHLKQISGYEEMTGFLAIGILALMVLLGAWLWIQTTLRRQRLPKAIQTIHAALSIAFFIVLFLHI